MDKRKPEFMFFSRSAHAYPGLGADEYIHADDLAKYVLLHQIRGWRKMMSNFYALSDEKPLFTLDGLNWRTVEHYFHAQKFKDSHPDYYRSFALDSGSALSRADGAAARRAGRNVKMTPDQISNWENGESKSALDKAVRAKYTQNEDLR